MEDERIQDQMPFCILQQSITINRAAESPRHMHYHAFQMRLLAGYCRARSKSGIHLDLRGIWAEHTGLLYSQCIGRASIVGHHGQS